MIVTIDGPAGTGKSTVAKRVARDRDWTFLDTGATYRAITWQAANDGIDPTDAPRLDALCRSIDLDFRFSPTGINVFVAGLDVTTQIRTEQISSLASRIAAVPEVRTAMVAKQRDLAHQFANVVTEGRDQGSVVFPSAELKIYLDASIDERAKRRFAELTARGESADFDTIRTDIAQRDERDRTRTTAPLIIPNDAVRIDTTQLTLDQVVAEVHRLIDERLRR